MTAEPQSRAVLHAVHMRQRESALGRGKGRSVNWSRTVRSYTSERLVAPSVGVSVSATSARSERLDALQTEEGALL